MDNPTAARLNDALRRIGALANDGDNLWAVFGTVRTAEREPAAGRTAVAYHLSEAGADVLGKATISADGGYRIVFDEAAFRNSPGGPDGPDTLVRIFDAMDQLLAPSATARNASRETRLDINIGNGSRVVRGRVTDTAGQSACGANVRVGIGADGGKRRDLL